MPCYDTIPDHPIFALATPYAKSALAIIRVSGRNSLELLYPMLDLHGFNTLPMRHATLCKLVDPKSGEVIDEALVTAFQGPHSYTGEDAAELSIHGSVAGIERVCESLRALGFIDAEGGEFTKRAFLHGKLDLTQAEAVHTIVNSQSSQEHMRAVRQLSGALSLKINALKDSIAHLAARCAISLDYPEDEIQENTVIPVEEVDNIIHTMRTLVASYEFSALQRKGARVVLGGRTNAGKSSLFNALVKEERSIVSDIHGTTRDYLECQMELKGIPIQFFDTAGLREDANTLEQIGIEKSQALLHAADAVLYVVDATCGWTSEDTRMFESVRRAEPSPCIIVWNKIDCEGLGAYAQNVPDALSAIDSVEVSATEYRNIDMLQELLFHVITRFITVPQHTDVLIHSLRQKQHIDASLHMLQEVRDALHSRHVPLDMISLDVDLALKELGAITGEVTTEEILDLMFSEFCVGK